MKSLILLLATVLIPVISGYAQLRQIPSLMVAKDDPVLPTLTKHQDAISAAYAKDKLILPRFSPWFRVVSPSGAKLFPELRFYTISWDENLHPEAPRGPGLSPIGRAIGLEKTVPIIAETNEIKADYPGFWEAIIERKVAIKDQEDAELVWNAFCEIHHKHWQSSPCKRIGPDEWRLGVSSYDQNVAADEKFKTMVTRTHYQRLKIDPETGVVLSSEGVVDTDNERKVPIEPAE